MRGPCTRQSTYATECRLLPPRPSPGTQAQLRHWKLTFVKLWEWVRHEASSAPARIVPVIFTDLNQQLGRVNRPPVIDDSIGQFQPGPETEVGQRVHRDLLNMEIMAPNTYYDLGFSFYGLRESRSRIDYFMTPQSLLPLVRR
eukprot:8654652-Pyramimonas_sp.AAC.1